MKLQKKQNLFLTGITLARNVKVSVLVLREPLKPIHKESICIFSYRFTTPTKIIFWLLKHKDQHFGTQIQWKRNHRVQKEGLILTCSLITSSVEI